MNISLGVAVSPSTKRGRSPRMPGDSAAANRGVALSRVGKQLLQGRRGTGRQPCPLHRECCVPATRRQKCGEHQTPEIGEAYMTGTIRTLRVDKGFGFIKSEAARTISFTRLLSMVRALPICARVME